MAMQPSNGTALITGASTGIGAIYAERLARRGYDLILVARNRERLEQLAQRLSEQSGRRVEVLVADLNDKADLARVEQLRQGGTIINIASIVGVAPELLNGVYGGTKAFVLAFSQSLQHELADKHVRIQAVLPGATATDFWEGAGTPVAHLPGEIVMQAQDMVDAALAGLDQGESITLPSLPEIADWQAYQAARQHLLPNLSHQLPAQRYRLADRAR